LIDRRRQLWRWRWHRRQWQRTLPPDEIPMAAVLADSWEAQPAVSKGEGEGASRLLEQRYQT